MNTLIHFRWHSVPGQSVTLTSAVQNINFNHTRRLDDPLCKKRGTSAPLGKHFPFQVHLGIGLTSVNVSFLSCFYLRYQRKTKSKLIHIFITSDLSNYVRFYIPFLPVDSSKCYSWAFNISWEASRFVATLIHVMVQHHQVLKETAVCVLTHQRGLTATDLCPWCFI